MTGEQKLLPCPFCGGKTIGHHYIRDGRAVACKDCHASVRAFYPNAPEMAFKAWNTRASAEPSASVREAAELERKLLDGVIDRQGRQHIMSIFAALSVTPSPLMQAAGKAAPQPSAENSPLRRCGMCMTWNSKPCGEQCGWSPDDPLFTNPQPSRIDAAAEPTREEIAKAAFNLAEAVECSIDLDLHPLLKKRVDATKSALKSKPRGEPAREGGEDVAAGLRPERA